MQRLNKYNYSETRLGFTQRQGGGRLPGDFPPVSYRNSCKSVIPGHVQASEPSYPFAYFLHMVQGDYLRITVVYSFLNIS